MACCNDYVKQHKVTTVARCNDYVRQHKSTSGARVIIVWIVIFILTPAVQQAHTPLRGRVPAARLALGQLIVLTPTSGLIRLVSIYYYFLSIKSMAKISQTSITDLLHTMDTECQCIRKLFIRGEIANITHFRYWTKREMWTSFQISRIVSFYSLLTLSSGFLTSKIFQLLA